MNNIFFISDTHFGQQRTLELSKRPFKDVKEMDEVIMNNWNRRVTNNDIIYHLGDFGNFDLLENNSLNFKELHLLYGNYERNNPNLKLDYENVKLINMKNLYLSEFGLELVHEPSNSTGTMFYLFGHIHALQKVKKNGLNVGVDCHNFEPISINDVMWYKNAIENHYDHDVFF